MKVDVKKLGELARVAVPEHELKELEKEIPEILSFVEQIQNAGGELKKETGAHYNILRDDGEPHESGMYTDDILAEMPDTKDGYLKVRKIIQQD